MTDDRFARLVEAERARLDGQLASGRLIGSIGYFIERCVRRLIRIGCGSILAVFAFWCGSVVIDALGTSLGALTLGRLLGAVLAAPGGVAAGLAAFAVAFGEAPPRPDSYTRAAETIRLQLEQERIEEAERSRVDAAYKKHGKIVGMLFDTTLAKRHKWLPFAAVGLIYLCILVFALVVR